MPPPQPGSELKRLLVTEVTPALGPERRASVWSESAINGLIQSARPGAKSVGPNLELVRCVALLWHDHLDAAHNLAQGIETPDGSWLHGILHRREPDYWNAKYWFKRTGSHPAFADLAQWAKPILDQSERSTSAGRLLRSGTWDPFAFVDAVEAALGPDGTDAERSCLRQLQALELETALDYFLSR